jgi:hypothetical protein
MPLLPENIALLPNGAYAEYLESIGRKAQVNNAVFLDLNRPDLFNRSDFKTPVHLNGAGGIKFSNALSALIEITLRENGQVAWLGGICSLNVMRTHLRHQ